MNWLAKTSCSSCKANSASEEHLPRRNSTPSTTSSKGGGPKSTLRSRGIERVLRRAPIPAAGSFRTALNARRSLRPNVRRKSAGSSTSSTREPPCRHSKLQILLQLQIQILLQLQSLKWLRFARKASLSRMLNTRSVNATRPRKEKTHPSPRPQRLSRIDETKTTTR